MLFLAHFVADHRGHGLSMIGVKSKRSDIVESIKLYVFYQAFHGLVHSFLKFFRSSCGRSKELTFGNTLVSCWLIFRVVVCGTIFDIVSLFMAPIAGITVWGNTTSSRIIILSVAIVVVSTTIVSLKRSRVHLFFVKVHLRNVLIINILIFLGKS